MAGAVRFGQSGRAADTVGRRFALLALLRPPAKSNRTAAPSGHQA